MINVVVGPHTQTGRPGTPGGLLTVQNSANFTGVNVTFQGGSALSGAGVYLEGGHFACDGCSFADNVADGPLGGTIMNPNIGGPSTGSPGPFHALACASFLTQSFTPWPVLALVTQSFTP